MTPRLQYLIDQAIDHGGPYITPASRAKMVTLVNAALAEQAASTRTQCLSAVAGLKEMTAGSISSDPGIQGIELAIEAALEVIAKVKPAAQIP